MLDRASICVRAGRGGNGSMSFRREKYVPKGGPDGGDGAPGGDVVLVATRQLHDLSHFRHKHHFRAQDGGQGRGANKRGADGPELLVQVPVGTEVLDADGEVLGDLVHEGQRLRVARGGEGGRGNVCFKSSTRQAPKFAERGLDGEELWLTLSLKLLADIGLVGSAQRRQVVASGRADARSPQDRGVPVHHHRAEPRRHLPGRGHGRHRRHPGAHRGRQRGRRARAPLPGAHRAHGAAAVRARRRGRPRRHGRRLSRRSAGSLEPSASSCSSARRSSSSTRPTCSTTPAGRRPARSSRASTGRRRPWSCRRRAATGFRDW